MTNKMVFWIPIQTTDSLNKSYWTMIMKTIRMKKTPIKTKTMESNNTSNFWSYLCSTLEELIFHLNEEDHSED